MTAATTTTFPEFYLATTAQIKLTK